RQGASSRRGTTKIPLPSQQRVAFPGRRPAASSRLARGFWLNENSGTHVDCSFCWSLPRLTIKSHDVVHPMSAENRRILIIDDERPILLTLEALLGRHGYQPEAAATASYGLRRLKEI